ncbi:PAS domain-containing protein [Agarivorans sp. TSD2052]|uniref:PAS domain-containing protein n=1 Tax=Agarivorans sp. TSD2052 TaxID=2937286 RepID=UPI00200F3D36|nr:PAS domain-containing protein [Agarivorans sp. TSD2052]UPW17310.1 PAS domain-containing protein [Agarivorans sp. TSD2052]
MGIDKLQLINTRTHCMDLSSDQSIVHSLDLSGTIIDVNPGWLKATGYERAEVIGKHFVEFLDMESLIKVQKNFPCLKDYGFVDNVQLHIVRKDHVVISVKLTGTSKYNAKGIFERTFCEMKCES